MSKIDLTVDLLSIKESDKKLTFLKMSNKNFGKPPVSQEQLDQFFKEYQESATPLDGIVCIRGDVWSAAQRAQNECSTEEVATAIEDVAMAPILKAIMSTISRSGSPKSDKSIPPVFLGAGLELVNTGPENNSKSSDQLHLRSKAVLAELKDKFGIKVDEETLIREAKDKAPSYKAIYVVQEIAKLLINNNYPSISDALWILGELKAFTESADSFSQEVREYHRTKTDIAFNIEFLVESLQKGKLVHGAQYLLGLSNHREKKHIRLEDRLPENITLNTRVGYKEFTFQDVIAIIRDLEFKNDERSIIKTTDLKYAIGSGNKKAIAEFLEKNGY